jgi:hypothetical protein
VITDNSPPKSSEIWKAVVENQKPSIEHEGLLDWNSSNRALPICIAVFEFEPQKRWGGTRDNDQVAS